MLSNAHLNGDPVNAWRDAMKTAEGIAQTNDYRRFVDALYQRFPRRFRKSLQVLNRDYLRIVDHHLEYLVPRVRPYIHPNTRKVLDFGCGSGGSAIALALAYPEMRFFGTDVDAREIDVARERAALYGVADRCEFAQVEESRNLPFADGLFDFSLCSSVIEYVIDFKVRKFCIQEMVRLVRRGGRLFFSVPNRLYPFEIHTRKWGWNYFPKLMNARTVDSGYWEVRGLAQPADLRLCPTPIAQFVRPWSNFCLEKVK